jgi:uncharacterized SAM-binding protein YcdF (DUF218 family)
MAIDRVLFLSKLVSLFIFPLGLAILLGIASALASRFRRLSRMLGSLAIVILWITSTPLFANWLTAGLESAYPPLPIERMPSADAVIILGGVLEPPRPPLISPNLNESIDRVIEGWRLFRAEKAQMIVVSGGNLPWAVATEPEADLIKRFLVELGVPENAIIVESDSRNTYENAVNTAGIFQSRGWRSGLLVTSGTHMPRAVAAFRRAGVEVVPAATDIQATYPLAASVLDLLPNAAALAKTTTTLKEWLGLEYYRGRGWA